MELTLRIDIEKLRNVILRNNHFIKNFIAAIISREIQTHVTKMMKRWALKYRIMTLLHPAMICRKPCLPRSASDAHQELLCSYPLS
jgi:hypothetical protein